MNTRTLVYECAVEALGWLHAAEGYALEGRGSSTEQADVFNNAAALVLEAIPANDRAHAAVYARRLKLSSVVEALQ